jgi:hypothetical protein
MLNFATFLNDLLVVREHLKAEKNSEWGRNTNDILNTLSYGYKPTDDMKQIQRNGNTR